MAVEFSPVLIDAPDVPPITLSEAKAHARVDDDAEDALIQIYIDAAASHLDGRDGILAGVCLVSQTWRINLSAFPDDKSVLLPLSPVSAVAVKYYDANNVLQTLSAADYSLSRGSAGYKIDFTAATFPALYDRPEPLYIDMTCGFGTTENVPSALKAAVLLIFGEMYKNRELTLPPGIMTNPFLARLVAPYRRMVA
jgi:uncharacterized phiE125 gp8 family phage protein